MTKVKALSARTFSSLSNRNFRLYMIGQAISLSGTWMQTVAQAWLVLKLSNSGTDLGLVTAMQFLPVLFLGPWGGVIADRLPKRPVLYATQAVSGVLALILGVLVATGAVELWMVYVLAGALGIVAAVDNPTRQVFVLEMVGESELNNAVTLNSVMVNLARVVGPALAGALIAGVGLAVCFLLNGASYAAVLVALAMMRAGELHTARPVPRARGQLRAGLRYVWSNPALRDTLIMMALVGTLAYEFQVSLPLLARFTFHGDSGMYATMSSVMGAGAVAGGLWTAGRRAGRLSTLAWSSVVFGAVILAAAVAPGLGAELAALVVVGAASITFLALGNTMLQLEAAPEMRGRVMALWSVAFLGSTPVGGPIIGVVGEHVGARWSLVVGGVAAVAGGAYGLARLRLAARRAGAPEALEAQAAPAPVVVSVTGDCPPDALVAEAGTDGPPGPLLAGTGTDG
jgi:MFS family permease